MICKQKECTGCFACYNICPNNAIEMKEDDFGCIYPHIEKTKCIECKLCKKVCPAIKQEELKKPIKCLAGRIVNKEDLFKATSGGIATELSKYFILNNGVVYGASFEKNSSVEHIRVDKIEELNKLRGSKYVHSYINDIYTQVKKDLIKNKKVLFIGTPCQIAGLKNYLAKEYKNLYLVDLICHGVPSQKYLREEVDRLVKTLKIDKVNFRDKKYNSYIFGIVKNNKNLLLQNMVNSPYLYTFMKGITFRENCYDCRYATDNRYSDLTIGDFWGLGSDSKFYKDKEKGVSVILPITNKGMELINFISNQTELEERKISEAVNGNSQLRTPTVRTKKTDKFKKIYLKKNFYIAYKKTMKKNYYKQKIKSNIIVKKILKLRDELKNAKK